MAFNRLPYLHLLSHKSMFTLAILIGVYSYFILALGLVGLLYKPYIFGLTIEFLILCLWFLPKKKIQIEFSKVSKFLLAILGVQMLINLVGALGPELGFDALWYHLTIPKIWLQQHHIFFISDGRYYYSVMPKLIEMYYVVSLSLGNEIVAKIIHFGFGILTLVVIYKLARRWLNQEYSLLACVIFYANLVVGWQSITAYVDLGRTFFEVLAFYYLVHKQVYKSGLILGLAVAVKLLALGSLPIFLVILLLQKTPFKSIIIFLILSFILVLPWLVFAFISTGNPVYPIFSGYDTASARHLSDFITIFTRSADPLSPIYLMLLPLLIYLRKKLPVSLLVYSLLAMIVWWLTPRTGGGRFIMPYLPVFSVLVALTIYNIRDFLLRKSAIILVIILAVISISYRAAANAKFIPVILGRQSKQDFLNRNLNHTFGENNFYLPDPLQK